MYKINLGGSGTPAASYSFGQHDFGNVIIDQTASVDLAVSNIGAGDLVIQSIQIAPSQFSYSHPLPDTIAPGNSATVALFFTPDNWGQYNGIVTITTNDPVNPTALIELSGYGIFSEQEIEVPFSMLDFSTVRAGAHTSRDLEISNQGATALAISNVSFGSPNFYLDPDVAFPLELALRDTVRLRVWFHAENVGTFSTSVIVQSNDSDEGSLLISLTATTITYDPDLGTEYWYYHTNTDNEKVIAIKKFVDLTGDGVEEILVADNEYGIHCLNGNSSGEADLIWYFSSYIAGIGIGSIYDDRGLEIAGDLNNDDVPDVIAGTAWGSRSVFALDGTDGEILWFYDTHIIGNGGWVYEVDAQRDFTGDGITDVLACTGDNANGTGPKRVFLFDGTDGTLIWDHPFTVAIAAVIGIADVTGDGIPEVVCGESPDVGDAFVYLLNGSNGAQIFSRNTVSSAVYALAPVGDISGDGLDDFAYGDFGGVISGISSTNFAEWTVNLGVGLITNLEVVTTVDDVYLLPAILGNQQFPFISATTGDVSWSAFPGGYILHAAPVTDLTGDEFFDILIGTLDHFFTVYSGADGGLIYSIDYGSPVEQTQAAADLDGNESAEMLVGLRNGWVYCLSGGTSATGPNEPPMITNITREPLYPTPDSVVNIYANITDDVAVISTTLFWGTNYFDISNIIEMIPTLVPDEYVTTTPIPAQPDSTSVFYYLQATDETDTMMTTIAAYWVVYPPQVVINEIMYNSAGTGGENQWIELYNNDSVAIDISGYILRTRSTIGSGAIYLPTNTTVGVGEYYTVAINIGDPPLNFIPNFDGTSYVLSMGSDSDGLRLFTANGFLVDSVSYKYDPPWPSEPHGGGPSLELLDPSSDNRLAENWAASQVTGGTPGAVNSVILGVTNEHLSLPTECALHQNYPNPFNAVTTIRYDLPQEEHVKIVVYDMLGRQVRILVNGIEEAGFKTIVWNAINNSGRPVSAGIYFFRISTGNFTQTKKLIFLK